MVHSLVNNTVISCRWHKSLFELFPYQKTNKFEWHFNKLITYWFIKLIRIKFIMWHVEAERIAI